MQHTGLCTAATWDVPCTGDEGSIRIGEGSNVQDNCSVHTNRSTLGAHSGATTIGDNVTVGHSVVLDCVTIEDEALIGMGATLLPGVKARPHQPVPACCCACHRPFKSGVQASWRSQGMPPCHCIVVHAKLPAKHHHP